MAFTALFFRETTPNQGGMNLPEDIILEMKEIEIAFPGVKALDKVDFTLRKGEVHSLLGENGAGKSTLIKCLTGVNHKDAGQILLEGKEINPTSPQQAMDLGISTVFQEINLCPNLTVAENIFIGRQPMKRGQIDWKTINRRGNNRFKKYFYFLDFEPKKLYSIFNSLRPNKKSLHYPRRNCFRKIPRY